MQDYGSMVRQLMQMAIPVGDVLPFIRKGKGPNPLDLTEGAGRGTNYGGHGVVDAGARISQKNREAYRAQWEKDNPEKAAILRMEEALLRRNLTPYEKALDAQRKPVPEE
jgi:hypothetical protein